MQRLPSLAWLALACQLGTVMPAAAQVRLKDRIDSTGSRPAYKDLIPLQAVVLNDGTYALVDNKSVFDRVKDKKAEATCPPGMRAMSAGFAAASGRGEPPEYRLILSKPNDQGTGWAVYALFDSKDDRLPAPYDWELRIRLVCLKTG